MQDAASPVGRIGAELLPIPAAGKKRNSGSTCSFRPPLQGAHIHSQPGPRCFAARLGRNSIGLTVQIYRGFLGFRGEWTKTDTHFIDPAIAMQVQCHGLGMLHGIGCLHIHRWFVAIISHKHIEVNTVDTLFDRTSLFDLLTVESGLAEISASSFCLYVRMLPWYSSCFPHRAPPLCLDPKVSVRDSAPSF